MVAALDRLVHHRWFQRAVLALIVLAAVVVGMETSPELMARYGPWLKRLDALILYAFALEAALKIAAGGKRWHRYFADPWNVFDFTIVVVCFIPGQGPWAAVLRLARVLRVFRLVTALPKLQLLVGSLVRSLPAMVYVGLLLMVMFYIYAVLGVFLFRGNDPVHFGDLPTAMLTLFRVVTLEDWTDVMYIQMYGSDAFDFSADYLAQFTFEPQPRPIVGAVYFISFVLLGTMIMLNLFIGVIIKSMEEAEQERAARQRAAHLAEHGRLTVGDELTEMEGKLKELMRHVAEVRDRAR